MLHRFELHLAVCLRKLHSKAAGKHGTDVIMPLQAFHEQQVPESPLPQSTTHILVPNASWLSWILPDHAVNAANITTGAACYLQVT